MLTPQGQRTGILSGYFSRMRAASACRLSAFANQIESLGAVPWRAPLLRNQAMAAIKGACGACWGAARTTARVAPSGCSDLKLDLGAIKARAVYSKQPSRRAWRGRLVSLRGFAVSPLVTHTLAQETSWPKHRCLVLGHANLHPQLQPTPRQQWPFTYASAKNCCTMMRPPWASCVVVGWSKAEGRRVQSPKRQTSRRTTAPPAALLFLRSSVRGSSRWQRRLAAFRVARCELLH